MARGPPLRAQKPGGKAGGSAPLEKVAEATFSTRCKEDISLIAQVYAGPSIPGRQAEAGADGADS